jgi:hypothetical protein
MCGCTRSLGAICAAFASMAAAAFLAQDRCLDSGGRLSDAAWVCESASGAVVALWSLVSPGAIGLVALAVGLPVYLAVSAIGNRWIAAYGRPQR